MFFPIYPFYYFTNLEILGWPGPAQREGYEPRQVRKEAAVVVVLCAAGRLAFINWVEGPRDPGPEKRTTDWDIEGLA